MIEALAIVAALAVVGCMFMGYLLWQALRTSLRTQAEMSEQSLRYMRAGNLPEAVQAKYLTDMNALAVRQSEQVIKAKQQPQTVSSAPAYGETGHRITSDDGRELEAVGFDLT